jgi:hypothetical protein
VYSDPPRHRLGKTLLFCLLALLHAALMLALWRSAIHLHTRNDIEALQLLILPAQPAAPQGAAAASTAAPQHPTPRAARANAPAATRPLPAASPQAAPENPATIDWTREAQSVAQQQAQLAALLPPRALDDRERHEVPGQKTVKPAPQFGWDPLHGHRVDMSGGALVVRLNERCAIVLMPLPLFACAVGGVIPVRGDLFDHMHDAPDLGAPPAPAP